MIKIIVFLVFISLACLNYKVVARGTLQVVNGTDADEGEFPYMVQLRSEDESILCGGSIIGPEWILTAAHCIDWMGIHHIVYGFNKPTKNTNTAIRVKKIFTNPNFTHKHEIPFYDLALLQLSQPIPLGPDAQTIKLVEANGNVPFHVETKYAGWGWTGYYNASRVPLQKITIQILTDDECRIVYNKASGENMDTDNNLCTENSFTGLCFGDSGSPLVVNGVQYGITSWIYEPCTNFPAAFTRISNPEYRHWIKEVSNI